MTRWPIGSSRAVSALAAGPKHWTGFRGSRVSGVSIPIRRTGVSKPRVTTLIVSPSTTAETVPRSVSAEAEAGHSASPKRMATARTPARTGRHMTLIAETPLIFQLQEPAAYGSPPTRRPSTAPGRLPAVGRHPSGLIAHRLAQLSGGGVPRPAPHRLQRHQAPLQRRVRGGSDPLNHARFRSSGGGTRTPDTRIMIP